MRAAALLAGLIALPCWGGSIEVQRDLPISKSGTRATVFTTPLKDASVEVVSVMQLRGARPSISEEVSVRDLLSNINRLEPAIRPRPNADFLLLNGGFSSEPTSRPAGLLIAGARTLSTPNYSRVKGNPQSSCEVARLDRFRLSALLCVPQGGAPEIRGFHGEAFRGCKHAIQAGPLLVEQNKQSVCRPAANPETSVRTSLCITGDAATGASLKVVVTQGPVSLFDLAEWLRSPAPQGGLGCRVAMNLGGDTSSAAALFARSRKSPLEPSLVAGDGTYPQASFIAVSTK